MDIREFIKKNEIEKQQLIDENKLLKDEIKELKEVNDKLIEELNSYIDKNYDCVEDTLSTPIETEDEQNVDEIEKPQEMTMIEPTNEETISIDDDAKPEIVKQKKNSRKKKTDVEEEVINLM